MILEYEDNTCTRDAILWCQISRHQEKGVGFLLNQWKEVGNNGYQAGQSPATYLVGNWKESVRKVARKKDGDQLEAILRQVEEMRRQSLLPTGSMQTEAGRPWFNCEERVVVTVVSKFKLCKQMHDMSSLADVGVRVLHGPRVCCTGSCSDGNCDLLR